mgnify:CR=1 FL=1
MEVDSQLDVSVDLGYLTLEQYNIVEEKIDRIARQLSVLRSKYNNKWSVDSRNENVEGL